MEKVKIKDCKMIFDGKAHGVEFEDGRSATAWNDKVNCGLLMQAMASHDEIEVEIKPYASKATGKTGLNIIGIVPVVITGAEAEKVYGIDEAKAAVGPMRSEKDRSIIAQTMMKCYYYGNVAKGKDEIIQTYEHFYNML